MTEGPRYGRRERGTHAQTNNAIPSWWPARRGPQRGRRQSQAARKRDLRAQSDLADAEERGIPTVHIARAKGWPEGATPKAARGFQVNAYAAGFDHCRWLYVLPNGDVLVAETDQPSGRRKSLRGLAMRAVMNRAGSGLPSANRITLLRDADGDGIAEIRTTFLENLHSPFGMTLLGDRLYVANTDAVVSFPYEVGQTRIASPGEKLVDLPAGPINHHWTKDIVASPDGHSSLRDHGLEQQRR